MRKKICLFAGTTEGRQLAEALHGFYDMTVCVATEYGEATLDSIEGIRICAGKMEQAEMERFFAENAFARVLDATHPYAAVVTENLTRAARAAGIPYLRILRDTESQASEAVYVASAAQARDYLMEREGNILLTTGAKELPAYVGLDMSRVWARVLPLASSLESCEKAGIAPAHIFAAQGPFSEEINLAQMRQIHARWMVTKASGKNGGFEEKMAAARAAGATPVIIGMPPQVDGVSLPEAIRELTGEMPPRRAVTILGIGPGGERELTGRARDALRRCDAVIGAKNVWKTLSIQKPRYDAYLPEDVRALLAEHPEIRRAAIVMRGDIGFYSGAGKLDETLRDFTVSRIPGIPSPVYFASALGIGWENVRLMSLHGRNANIVRAVDTNRKVMALTGGENTVSAVCGKLCEFGFGALPVTVGERLSFPEETITRLTAEEARSRTFDTLSILLIENENAVSRVRHGIADEEFSRGNAPMTKSEVRSLSLAALALTSDAVVYDIGAGTGSVSIECALAAYDGQVFAIEREQDACELIRANKRKFHTDNVCIVEGTAPEAMASLPAPTHAFIGGSSGNLKEILSLLLEKNPQVRIVINTVTMETQAEAAACAGALGLEMEMRLVSAARARKAGRYHMMCAQNPVSVFVMRRENFPD